MIVSHVKPESWVDTGEAGKIQPSEVAGLAHVVSLSPEDVELLRGPQGLPGADGAPGPQGPQGPQGNPAIFQAGAVLFFAMNAAPAGWKVCDGSLVSRATYAALFAAIGTIYGAGDGATTFKLPDLRGEFIRGTDGGRGVDAGRALGSAQGDQNKAHSHTFGYTAAGDGTPGGPYYSIPNLAGAANVRETNVDGGAEARPRNVALLPCISTGGV